MALSTEIELVCFDLGRVLLRIADDWKHAYDLAGLGHLEAGDGDISAGTRRKHDAEAERFFHGFETGKIETDEFLAFASSSRGIAAHEAASLLDAWLLQCFEGVDELLDALDPLPVRTACLSNTNARHWIAITDPSHPAFIPVHRLDWQFASQLVGHAKPADEIYQHVEQTTGISSEKILFFDDLPENLDAASKRGWHTQLVPRCDNPIPMITDTLRAYRVLP